MMAFLHETAKHANEAKNAMGANVNTNQLPDDYQTIELVPGHVSQGIIKPTLEEIMKAEPEDEED